MGSHSGTRGPIPCARGRRTPGWGWLGHTGWMVAQFIYTMRNLARFYPPDRQVLKGINLSFYPGAKIGVIGSNGSGKSSLLKIMAGLDDGSTGEARLTPGFTVGYLRPRARTRSRPRTWRETSRTGWARSRPWSDRFNEVCAALRRTRRRFRRPPGRAIGPAGQDRCGRRVGSRADLRDRHGCASAPPVTPRSRHCRAGSAVASLCALIAVRPRSVVVR